MKIKSHYKLYKLGKLWMTAMISAAVLRIAGIAEAADNPVTTVTGNGDTVNNIESSQPETDLNSNNQVVLKNQSNFTVPQTAGESSRCRGQLIYHQK